MKDLGGPAGFVRVCLATESVELAVDLRMMIMLEDGEDETRPHFYCTL